jgi:hypothetical protein
MEVDLTRGGGEDRFCRVCWVGGEAGELGKSLFPPESHTVNRNVSKYRETSKSSENLSFGFESISSTHSYILCQPDYSRIY